MLRDDTLELAGPVSVIATIWCADLAAHALAIWPSSRFLWYLNLEVFRAFRDGFDAFSLSRLGSAFGPVQWLWLPIALIGLVWAGLVAKMKLLLAIASNLSFIYSGALLYGGLAANPSQQLGNIYLDRLLSPTFLLAALILVVSLLSCTVSHRGYWREILA